MPFSGCTKARTEHVGFQRQARQSIFGRAFDARPHRFAPSRSDRHRRPRHRSRSCRGLYALAPGPSSAACRGSPCDRRLRSCRATTRRRSRSRRRSPRVGFRYRRCPSGRRAEISRSFASCLPVAERPIDSTDVTLGSSRHSRNAAWPIMPVAPNRMIFKAPPRAWRRADCRARTRNRGRRQLPLRRRCRAGNW